MLVEDRITGKQGKVYYGDPGADKATTDIPITGWSAKVRKHFQDTTSSRNYDPETKLVYPTHVPCAIDIEGSIEGLFRLQIIPQTLIKSLFEGEDPFFLELWLDNDNRFAAGYFTISEFNCDSPIHNIVLFRALVRGHGVVQIGDFAGVALNG